MAKKTESIDLQQYLDTNRTDTNEVIKALAQCKGMKTVDLIDEILRKYVRRKMREAHFVDQAAKGIAIDWDAPENQLEVDLD